MRYDTDRLSSVIRFEDLTAQDDLTPLPSWTSGAKAISDEQRVSEEHALSS